LFPGVSPSSVKSILDTPGLKALVLETFGSGNAPSAPWLIQLFKESIDRGIIILNISQCPGGMVVQGKYATSKWLKEIGVISGGDMTTEAAVTKLMILIGEQGVSKTMGLIGKPIAGEISA
jgi:L-asparaginase